VKSVLFAAVGVVLMLLAIYSYAQPTFCADGCGNLTEPVFRYAYIVFGPWGVRGLLLASALLFFWGAANVRD